MAKKILIVGLVTLCVSLGGISFYISKQNVKLRLEKAELGTEIVKLKTANMQLQQLNNDYSHDLEYLTK